MPRYQITAPDGRVVVVEGERPPTEEDAAKIFTRLQPKGRPRDTLGTRAQPAPQEKLEERGVGGLLADMALEGGGATAGQAIGAIPVLSVPTFGASIPIGGAIGGVAGNLASQKRRILAGEQPGFRLGEAVGSALTGAIPGASLEAAGARSIAREAAKQGIGGVAGKTIETVVDEGRLPSAREAIFTSALPAVGGGVAQKIQSGNPTIRAAANEAMAGPGAAKRATLEAGKEMGYLVVPSDVNPSFLNKRLESLAGPADIRRGVGMENQRVTNRGAAEDIGLPPNTEITRPLLEEVRRNAARPYQEIAALSPESTAALAALRDARNEATQQFRFYERSADPQALRRAREANDLAETLEGELELAATTAGRPELVAQMRESRQLIAKTYDVERGLNVGDSGVSAPIMGRALDAGKPLSGNLETIGRFAEAFPRSVQEVAKIYPTGLSRTESITGALLAGGALSATQHPAAAMAFLAPPVASAAARRLVLSRPYQSLMTDLPIPPINAMPDMRALPIRTGTQEAAQELADEVKPEPEKEEPRKSASADTELRTLTPSEAKTAAPGKFRGTNGQTYEKLENGKIRRA